MINAASTEAGLDGNDEYEEEECKIELAPPSSTFHFLILHLSLRPSKDNLEGQDIFPIHEAR